ncbi:MAG TPA: 6-carboxytetrahydropterin synthase [Candidatus Saccharimonadales bacterium]|nr:6-carboxytetrahydropterin synthase [Candidatus Saccharimonadales bacterium]
MKVYLTRRYPFSASHRLHNAALSDAVNRETYGKCNNPHGHGHNYFLEVTVSGPLAPETGMVCDLEALDSTITGEILNRFDHQNLNQLQDFGAIVPTTENLTIRIHQILRQTPLPAHLESIRVEETANNSFEFAGIGQPRR